MTGSDLRAARERIGKALLQRMSYADLALLCGLADPSGNGKDTMRKWEDGDGPSGPVSALIHFMLAGLESKDSATQDFFRSYIMERLDQGRS